MAPSKFKILFIDIETSPHIVYAWGLRKENISIDQIIKSSEMICFAAEWDDSNTAIYKSIYHNSKKEMLDTLYKLLNEADMVVHINGKTFDIPIINKEFLLAGYTPPSPFEQLDVQEQQRKIFRFASVKLDFTSKILGFGGKVDHEGFELWSKCLNNDAKAWDLMRKYNLHDTHLTKLEYHKILPWFKSHPNRSLYTGEYDRCPQCGSKDIKLDGSKKLRAGVFQQYKCLAKGCWFRGTKPLVRGVLKYQSL